MRFPLLAVVPLLAVTGCAYESRQPPVSTAPTQAAGPPSMAPQSPNSLPLGSQVSAPLTPAAGNVSSVRVGPGSSNPPVTSTTQPTAGTGTATATGRPNRVQNGY